MKTTARALVVDDEASVRKQLSRGLSERGYAVEDCEDGLTALKKIESARIKGIPYNYVILDLRLPDIAGLKVLELIRSKYPDLAVVAITGYGDEDTRDAVKKDLRNGYLDKPFKLEELEAELKRLGPGIAEPQSQSEPSVRHPAGAYIFIRGKSDADLEKIFVQLYSNKKVIYCDAVRGDWDLVLLVQAEDRKAVEELVKQQVNSIPGIAEIEVHYSERAPLAAELESFISAYALKHSGETGTDKRDRKQVSAYAVLEVDRSQLAPLFAKLSLTDTVVNCDATDNGSQIILLLQGRDFEQIRRTWSSQVRTQPGVVRMKMLDIMELMKM